MLSLQSLFHSLICQSVSREVVQDEFVVLDVGHQGCKVYDLVREVRPHLVTNRVFVECLFRDICVIKQFCAIGQTKISHQIIDRIVYSGVYEYSLAN